MPVGFRELALTGHLSIQLMTRLNITRSEIVHLMATAPSDDKDKEWQTLMRASSSIERMAWLTVLVFHLRSSTYISDCKELAEVALECAEIGAKSQAQSEWLLWAACLMIATPDCEKVLGKHRDRVAAMVLQNYNHLTVDQMNSNAERFLWSEGLSASLEVHIRYQILTSPYRLKSHTNFSKECSSENVASTTGLRGTTDTYKALVACDGNRSTPARYTEIWNPSYLKPSHLQSMSLVGTDQRL